jgi:hypothetical protein
MGELNDTKVVGALYRCIQAAYGNSSPFFLTRVWLRSELLNQRLEPNRGIRLSDLCPEVARKTNVA